MTRTNLRWTSIAALFLFFSLTTSCTDNPPTVSASSYDTRCTSSSDCTPVWVGNVCSCDDLGAINKSVEESFQRDKSSLQEDCSSIPQCASPSSRWKAACNGGTCIVQARLEDAGTDDADSNDDASPDGTTDAAEDTGDDNDTTAADTDARADPGDTTDDSGSDTSDSGDTTD